MMNLLRFLPFATLATAAAMAACSFDASDGSFGAPSPTSGGADSESRSALACSTAAIPPPRDLPPEPNGGPLCLSASLSSMASLVGRDEGALAKLDADVLVGDCVSAPTPAGLTFVIGAALRKDETGKDYASDVRVPLPSAVRGAQGPSLANGATLLVAKVAEFRGESVLRFVNVATVKEENGKRFIETLPEAARRAMSPAMKVDGPGLYAFYLSSAPVGFVSGSVKKGGSPADGAVVLGTTAPFLTVADATGCFTLPLSRGEKASLAAYDLSTRWTGEAHLPIEEGGKTNPKTNAPVESPAKDQPIEGLDALNLVGVTVALTAPDVAGEGSADFESGDLGGWTPHGSVSVLGEKMSQLFPATREKRYAFLTTGKGSSGGTTSHIAREVTIPTSASTLVIDYAFLSQEYPAWVNTIYNDAFVAYVVGDTGFLLTETVTGNDGRWSDFFQPVGNVTESKVDVGGVSGKFGGTTGARTKRIDVSGCGGQTVTLALGVADVGDSIYDSAVVIDRIAFE